MPRGTKGGGVRGVPKGSKVGRACDVAALAVRRGAHKLGRRLERPCGELSEISKLARAQE